jgi:hypothetical protein
MSTPGNLVIIHRKNSCRNGKLVDRIGPIIHDPTPDNFFISFSDGLNISSSEHDERESVAGYNMVNILNIDIPDILLNLLTESEMLLLLLPSRRKKIKYAKKLVPGDLSFSFPGRLCSFLGSGRYNL